MEKPSESTISGSQGGSGDRRRHPNQMAVKWVYVAQNGTYWTCRRDLLNGSYGLISPASRASAISRETIERFPLAIPKRFRSDAFVILSFDTHWRL